MLIRSAAIFLFLAALGTMTVASAQVWTPMPPPKIDMQNRIWTTFRVAQIGNQVAADMARSRGGAKPAGTGKANVPKPVNAQVYQKQFAFQRNPSSPLAAKMAGPQTGDAAKMQQLIDYAWGNFRTSFADENRRLGMPFDDVASAMTYYIVGGYMYATDAAGIPSEHSVEVYRQVASVLGKDPEFTKLADADKQMLADLLVIMGSMPVIAFEQRRDKRDQMAAARVNLERIFGTNAAKVKITENGIEF